MAQMITQVWCYNFDDEMSALQSMLETHRIVSIDTEFPRLIRNTPRQADEFDRYEDVKFNIASSILIQVGITLSDEEGDVGGTWQFNLVCGDMAVDYVNCLRLEHGGVPFVKAPWTLKGIPHAVFADKLRAVVREFYGEVKWVTFHGLYDLAHLIPLLTSRPLPDSVFGFAELLESCFGRIYDIKAMAGFCRDMFPEPEYLGLQKMADMLGVKRVGRAHQAGSDSLVTAGVFRSFITLVCKFEGPIESPVELEGFIYDVSTRIILPGPWTIYHSHHRLDTQPFLSVASTFQPILVIY